MAHGYVLKGADGAETLRAIYAAASGEAIFSPTITRRLTKYFATPGREHTTRSEEAFSNLTEREHEILTLMAEGYTNNAIASRLYLSPKTVRNYVSSIFTKLQVSDRSQAIVYSREAGLGTREETFRDSDHDQRLTAGLWKGRPCLHTALVSMSAFCSLAAERLIARHA